MKPKLYVVEEALVEARDAMDHLSAVRPGLATAFREALARAFSHLQEFPESGQSAEFGDTTRRWKLARFPYSIIYLYSLNGERLVVIAVAHESRRPSYWRLRQR